MEGGERGLEGWRGRGFKEVEGGIRGDKSGGCQEGICEGVLIGCFRG